MVRRLLAISIMSTAVVACGSTSTSSPSGAGAYAGKTIVLGAAISKTGPGGIYGPAQEKGIQLAEDELNASGGVNGAHLSVTIQDDRSDKTQAAQDFQTLIQGNRVMALIGPTLSNSAVAADPIANQAKTPVVAVSNTGVGIVGQCPYPCDYIFRDSLGEASAVPANVADFVNAHHPASAVILYANDDKFSSDGDVIFKRSLTDQHVTITGDIGLSKNEVDVRSFATQAIGTHPDVVVLSALGGVATKLTVALRSLGYAGPILGGNGFNTNAVSKAFGAAGKGAQSASAYFVGTASDANRRFVDSYRRKYGEAPDQIAAQAYTGVLIIAEAARNANLTFSDLAGDRTRLRDALKSVSLTTPLGDFSFTSQHDVRQSIYIVAMDGAGGFTLVDTVKPG